MRKFLNNRFFKLILPNIVIVLTCMMITLYILDYYNPLMGFLSRGMSIGVMILWGVMLVGYIIVSGMRLHINRS